MTIRRFGKVIGFFAAVLVVMAIASPAEAAVGGKLGDVIDNVRKSFANFQNLFSMAAYFLGLFFSVSGIFKFKDHVDNPAQNPISAGVKRFLAGGMMFSLPYTINAVKGTLLGDHGSAGFDNTSRHGAPGGDGMDHMIVNFVSNVYGPMSMLLTVFTYIAAIGLMVVAVTRLTKTAQEGPRGPAGLGTIMTFLASGALFSFADMIGSFSSSLFGDAVVSTNANISSSVISNAADSEKISAVIESLMAFIMIVGYIAFIRGWFVLKAFADGAQNASLAQALTFLFGGALAINMGELVNVLQNTVGISGITFG